MKRENRRNKRLATEIHKKDDDSVDGAGMYFQMQMKPASQYRRTYWVRKGFVRGNGN